MGYLPGLIFQTDRSLALVQQCLESACKSSHNSREQAPVSSVPGRTMERTAGPARRPRMRAQLVVLACLAALRSVHSANVTLARSSGCCWLLFPHAARRLGRRAAVLQCVFKPATLTRARPHAQVPGFPVSGKMYVQSVSGSTVAGAAGTAPGSGARRLLGEARRHLMQAQMPTVNIANQTALEDELVSTVAAFNAGLAVTSGRRLLQTPTGLEVDYACAPARSLHTG